MNLVDVAEEIRPIDRIGHSRAAVTAVLSNVILNLERYELSNALTLAEILQRERASWCASVHFDVFQMARFRDTLNHGVECIQSGSHTAALTEFNHARRIWLAGNAAVSLAKSKATYA